MGLLDPSLELLATRGGDTVRIFDIKLEPNDSCVLSYSPSPNCFVNSVKWNHTNLVVACAGEDKKISLWRNNGQRMWTVLVSGTDCGETLRARAAELKDPNEKVLSVLDYSRTSRPLLVTAGDDGSIHLWDTTGSRRPSSFVSHEAPFTSLAFRDDGWTLAAGTNNGSVVFYDIRGKLKPFTVFRAYSSSEAVSSLCWQRSKPAIVNERTCTAETALLGDAVEDSVLMPDPLPSVTSTNLSASTAISGSLITSRSGGTLMRLHAPRSKYNLKDDMDVFSPVVDVQPIKPSLDKLWDNHDGAKKEHLLTDKKPSSLLFASSRRFGVADDGARDHPIFDWKPSSMSRRSFTSLGSMSSTSSKSEEASMTTPGSWGGEKISDKFAHLRLLPSRFGMEASGGLTTSFFYSGQSQSSMLSQMSVSSLTSSDISYENLHAKDVTSNHET
ncbi:hypothetical protein F3Y22_tig00110864pilonHSYRG00029 [Hibiscus syriacus]|uniref:Uncharacterized protein n=1 Tax=Hibiscus syriacus TaxID=106335 RepID=A0A6A2ZLW6_HIBSY|nr:hypothetical protein F3Y22_tig00110864pilonHSYRG00029 [Hibiscus syriacus]